MPRSADAGAAEKRDGADQAGSGAGAEPDSGSSSSSTGQQQTAPPAQAPPAPAKDDVQTAPPEMPGAGEGFEKTQTVIRLNVNFVELPVTVKDSKGHLVAGLTLRDFKVYENDTCEPLRLFTVDPFPLSIAFVIDQSLTCGRDGQGERLAGRDPGRADAL